MDVNTSGLSTGGYRGGHYYGASGGAAPAATTGEDGAEEPTVRVNRPAQFGSDSLVGVQLARKGPTKSEMSPDQALKVARIIRAFGVCLGGLSCFAFLTIFLQPILLPLFTFGACFTGGFNEWLQFSFEALKVSVIPLVVGLVSAWAGYFSHRKIHQLEKTMQQPGAPALGRS